MSLVWLGGAWLAGIALGLAGDGWWRAPTMLGTALVAFATLYPEYRRRMLPLLLAPLIVAAAAWRADLGRPAPARLPSGTIDAVRGVIVDWPVRGGRDSRATLRLTAARADGAWSAARGQVRVVAPLYPELWHGDQVETAGYLRTSTAPSWRDSLARRGLDGEFQAFNPRVVAGAPRTDLAGKRAASVADGKEALLRALPQPQAGLVIGIVLGDASQLPSRLRESFNATGTSHVMALSGWNIALVAGMLQLLGRRLGRARGPLWLLCSSAVLWGYTLLVGSGPTIVRAAIMGTLYLLATATGRRGDALTALVFAATIMTAVAPGVLLDIGFELSCAATAGLVLLSGRLARALKWAPPFIAEGMAATVAAEIFTLPLVIHYFGRVSIVSLPSNLLIEPLVPLIMFGGAATLLANALLAPVAPLVGLAPWLPAQLLLFVVERLGNLPGARLSVPPLSWGAVMLAYAFIALALILLSRRPLPIAALLAPGSWSLAAAGRGLIGFCAASCLVLWVGLLARWFV